MSCGSPVSRPFLGLLGSQAKNLLGSPGATTRDHVCHSEENCDRPKGCKFSPKPQAG